MKRGRVYKSPPANLAPHIVLKGCAGLRLPQLKESRAAASNALRPALALTCSACG